MRLIGWPPLILVLRRRSGNTSPLPEGIQVAVLNPNRTVRALVSSTEITLE